MSKAQVIAGIEELIKVKFHPTIDQRKQLENPKDTPERIIQGAEAQLFDLRGNLAKAIPGLSEDDIELSWVTRSLVLDTYVTGHASNTKLSILNGMKHEHVYEMGIRHGQRNAGPMNDIAALYIEVFDRKHDQGGFDYWRGKLQAGMPLPEIKQHFIDAKANGSR